MKADRILCIRVKCDTIVTVPEDEIWNVSVFDVSEDGAKTFDVSSSDEQFGFRRVSRILGGVYAYRQELPVAAPHKSL